MGKDYGAKIWSEERKQGSRQRLRLVILNDIYKTYLHVDFMKLKDVLSKISENRSNGQLNTCIKKNSLKKAGITESELFDMNIDTKLKRILFED